MLYKLGETWKEIIVVKEKTLKDTKEIAYICF